MGASNPYTKYETTIKHDDKWQAFLKKFNLTAAQGKKLWLEFKKMDKKSKGEINFKMWSANYKITKEDLGAMEKFFKVLKKDRSTGEMVYFQEWACMTYDFCTLKMDGMVEWTFRMFDPDNTGDISKDEFMEMTRLCMGEDYVKAGTPQNKKAVILFRELDKNNNKKLTLQEFRAAEKAENAPLLFAAIMELQEKMRKKLLGGEKFWKAAEKVRATVGLGSPPWGVYSKGGNYVRPLKGKKAKKPSPMQKKVGPAPDEREDD